MYLADHTRNISKARQRWFLARRSSCANDRNRTDPLPQAAPGVRFPAEGGTGNVFLRPALRRAVREVLPLLVLSGLHR